VIQRQPSHPTPNVPRFSSAPRAPAWPTRGNGLMSTELIESARWRVQLELAPAEIAFVYRHGLARGAEVCRSGTQDWRPLVTTPELRQAIAKRARRAAVSQPALAALMLAQSTAITDPGLAKLFLVPRPPHVPKSVPPPPPPVPKTASVASAVVERELPGFPMPDESGDGSASEQTELSVLAPRQLLPPLPVPLARRSRALAVLHARPLELSLVAAVAVFVTFAVSAWALHVPKATALASRIKASIENENAHEQRAVPPPEPPIAHTIPVISFGDLPLESGAFRVAAPESASSLSAPRRAQFSPSSAPDRGALARALAHAARSAQACGGTSVNTQVVVTFAPSGGVRDVHFNAPPAQALRSCILRAVARSQVTPFTGAPITVSKTLRW
jgi:hypothetical protein